jgi:hypothetical protein
MLPIELQDEVWKCYVVQTPQIMTLPLNAEIRAGYPGNPPLLLRQINKHLWAQPLAAYGYVSPKFSKLFYANTISSLKMWQLLSARGSYLPQLCEQEIC